MKCLLPQKHGLVGPSESGERNSVLSLFGESELTRLGKERDLWVASLMLQQSEVLGVKGTKDSVGGAGV